MTAHLARRVTPAAVAYYRRHPGTAGAAACMFVGYCAAVGGFVGWVIGERAYRHWTWRRAA